MNRHNERERERERDKKRNGVSTQLKGKDRREPYIESSGKAGVKKEEEEEEEKEKKKRTREGEEERTEYRKCERV